VTFAQFTDTEAGLAWVMSTAFESACCELFREVERRPVRIAEAAELIGLPIAAFIELLPAFFAIQRTQCRSARVLH
jgi:hypothetical protein